MSLLPSLLRPRQNRPYRKFLHEIRILLHFSEFYEGESRVFTVQWQKRAEGRIEIAKNLIAMKLGSIEQIAQASGLSVEGVLKLAGKN